LIPYAPEETPRVAVAGAALGPVEIMADALVDGRAAFTDSQRLAYDAVQSTLEAYNLAEDAVIRAASGVQSAQDALAMLRSLSGAQLQTLQPDAVGPFAAAVSSNITAAETARADARATLREAERARDDARLQYQQAEQVWRASGARITPVSQLAVGVTLDEPGTVAVAFESFSTNAGWSPSYDITLDAENRVTFDRKATLWQNTEVPFERVDITLSTVNPFAQIAPTTVLPNQAVLEANKSRVGSGSYRAPSEEASISLEGQGVFRGGTFDIGQALTANMDGAVVTYDYPSPIDLKPNGERVTLALDSVWTEARIFNRASVRTDRTAFLMAEITNTVGEPLLPGEATFYRENTRIGEAALYAPNIHGSNLVGVVLPQFHVSVNGQE
jgi:hypothetical protein